MWPPWRPLTASVGTQANEVIDGFLWLGSRSDAAHAFWLEAMGITHVLNVAGASARGHVEGVTYLELDGEDDEDYELLRELWPRCKAFLDGARSSAGARVLVHCSAGINRSACIAGESPARPVGRSPCSSRRICAEKLRT